MPDQQTITERRAARKAAKRRERAARAAAIDAAWLAHMFPTTPAEPAPWPSDLPRPSLGFAAPSVSALAEWLGVPNRRFAKDEIRRMVDEWRSAVHAAGVDLDTL